MALVSLGTKRHSERGFFNEYLKYTSNQESPYEFHLWTVIGLVSSALGRNVFINRGYFKLFPNLYIVLVAESGMLRKSSAIRIGERMLKQAVEERATFSQKITTEAMIGFLNQQYESHGESIAIIIAPEFSVFFGKSIQDPTILQTLTDLYDCPDKWAYSTRGRGEEVVNRCAVSMIAGTTPEWIKSSLPEDSIGGGFAGRIIFVYRTEQEKRIAFPEDYMSNGARKIREQLLDDLRTIADLHGEFRWTKDGKESFRMWYEDVFEIDAYPNSLRGYVSRKADYVLKISMIASASKGDDLKISPEDVEFALTILEQNEKHLFDVLKMVTETDTGRKIGNVLKYLKKYSSPTKGVIHSQVMRAFSYAMDRNELYIIISTLESGGQIKVDRSGRGTIYYYVGG